jgi:anti-sigma regulatory factor (Ser/Thr protein kinase)
MQLSFHEGEPTISGVVRFEDRFRSTVEEKERILGRCLDELRGLGVRDQRELFRYRLCLDEVIQNAIQHGNRSEPAKLVELRLFDAGDAWGVVVTDEGEGFDGSSVPDTLSPEALLRENGRGLWILCEYMDQVAYYNGGRTAFLRKRKAVNAPV